MPKEPPTSSSRTLDLMSGRAWLYARVSKDLRDGSSCDQQLTIGRRECEREGVPVAGEYRDDDISASQYAKRARADWDRLMDDLKADAQPGDRLWGWEISRLARERGTWSETVRLLQDLGMFLWVGGKVYDPQSPQDMFFLDIMLAKAVAEVGDTRQRILRDVAARAEAGGATGKPGYGFEHVYDSSTGAFLERRPKADEAEVVAEMADRLLAGDGLETIARNLNARKVPNSIGRVAGEQMPNGKASRGWTAATVRSMLMRSSIMGKRSWKGRLISEGGWEGIVSEDDWHELQRILKSKSGQVRDGRASHELSGIATCGAKTERAEENQMPKLVRCGCRVYAEPAKHGRVYRCRGRYAGDESGHVTRKADLIEEQATGLLMEHFSRPDVKAALLAPPDENGEAARARAEVQRLKQELEELYEDVRARRVSRALAAADEEGIRAELKRLEGRVRPRAVDPMLIALARNPRAAWAGWSVEQRRKAWRAAVARLDVLPVGRVGRRQVPVEESILVEFVDFGAA
ncbi:recombinase family protein [Nocardiopsis changdeensis]|uniref:Recombinase family protein n=1 Tax=Nocardiopsis changdeensis TaxID=2831969 RepID=A0ABX8BG97_9ACTN|nr:MULTISPECIES: recombinase family protein [Nocardiopsis]QUX20369.1 recombinase family protein [Nocardiopsis changdeensis]QYX36299.1 recombinase family protein [Nocardiopsis sp. MT53]